MWEKLKIYRNYLSFISTTILFLIIVLALFRMYWGWNKTIESPVTTVEINLPVLDWQRYTNLSKQYSPPEPQ